MQWYNLVTVLEEYNQYLNERSVAKMPDYWALREKISFTLQIDNSFYNITFNGPEYWKWAQYGRGPGKMPPRDAILNWIERRGITPRQGNSLPAKNSLAYLIQRKIAREGTKGIDYLDSTIQEAELYFKEKISDAISQDISLEVSEFLGPIFTGVVDL